jgi:recombination protein RecT
MADNSRGNMKSGAVAKVSRQNPVSVIRGMLDANSAQLDAALVKQIDKDQFVRICMTHFQRGGDRMMEADPRTFVAACVEAAQLGLKPDSILGECYLLPRKDKRANGGKGGYAVNFQIGYRGVMKLVRRGGEVSEISAEIAYENDEFSVELGTSRRIVHRPWYTIGAKEPGKIVAAYAIAKLTDGIQFKVLPESELVEISKMSGNPFDAKQSNVWANHPAAMRMKTASLRLCKWLPMPDDSKRALLRDDNRESGIEDSDASDIIESIVVRRDNHSARVDARSKATSLDDLIPAIGE